MEVITEIVGLATRILLSLRPKQQVYSSSTTVIFQPSNSNSFCATKISATEDTPIFGNHIK